MWSSRKKTGRLLLPLSFKLWICLWPEKKHSSVWFSPAHQETTLYLGENLHRNKIILPGASPATQVCPLELVLVISGSSLRNQESWAPARDNLSRLIIHHSPPPLEQMFVKHLHCVMHSGTTLAKKGAALATLTDMTMTIKSYHLFRPYSVPGVRPHDFWLLLHLILCQTPWPKCCHHPHSTEADVRPRARKKKIQDWQFQSPAFHFNTIPHSQEALIWWSKG